MSSIKRDKLLKTQKKSLSLLWSKTWRISLVQDGNQSVNHKKCYIKKKVYHLHYKKYLITPYLFVAFHDALSSIVYDYWITRNPCLNLITSCSKGNRDLLQKWKCVILFCSRPNQKKKFPISRYFYRSEEYFIIIAFSFLGMKRSGKKNKQTNKQNDVNKRRALCCKRTPKCSNR